MAQDYQLQLVTGPTTEPVSLEEAKLQVHRFDDEEDLRINGLIKSAREFAETYTSRSFLETTWKLTLCEFGREIVLPRPPLKSVTSITYTDTNDAAQTLAANQYVVDTIRTPGRIVPAVDVSWPSVSADNPNPIQITYKAGYASSAVVPQGIKDAILLLVQHLYDHNEGIPRAVMSLLSVHSWGDLV